MDTTNLRFNEAWVRSIEELVLPALDNRLRVLGLTAAHTGAGVTTLALAAAEMAARSGAKVLYIDFSNADRGSNQGEVWIPGEVGALSRIVRNPAGFDMLASSANSDTRYAFNNAKRLRRALVEELAEYSVVIADLPDLLDERADSLNPLSVATVCDQVLMVCANGITSRKDAAEAAESARRAGVKLGGIVWNNMGRDKLGAEMARSAQRRFAFFPPLARFLERRFSRSPFLNG